MEKVLPRSNFRQLLTCNRHLFSLFLSFIFCCYILMAVILSYCYFILSLPCFNALLFLPFPPSVSSMPFLYSPKLSIFSRRSYRLFILSLPACLPVDGVVVIIAWPPSGPSLAHRYNHQLTHSLRESLTIFFSALPTFLLSHPLSHSLWLFALSLTWLSHWLTAAVVCASWLAEKTHVGKGKEEKMIVNKTTLE